VRLSTKVLRTYLNQRLYWM